MAIAPTETTYYAWACYNGSVICVYLNIDDNRDDQGKMLIVI